MTIALPRVRDFRGVSPKGFDGRGNFTLGLKDQLLFPEIDYMKVDKARGMNVSVVTSAAHRRGSAQAAAIDWDAVQSSGTAGSVGHYCKDRERTQDTEIQGSSSEPLPSVRPARAYLRKFALCRPASASWRCRATSLV